MEKISDLNKYNERMARAIDDKLFFVDYLDGIDTIVDFGCADGAILEKLPKNLRKIGYDNSEEMRNILR